MADTAKAVDDQTQLLSDLATQWGGVRDLVESFANTYYLKEPVKQATAQQLLQAGLDFTSQLTMIWVKSIAITAREGVRMAKVAVDSAQTPAQAEQGTSTP